MSAKVSVSSKERVLSPKRKKDFKGQLVVLDEGLPGDTPANEKNTRPSSASKKVSNRPSSGSLEVLKSEKDAASLKQATCSNPTRPGSGRTEKKLPTVKRKEQKHCICSKDGCQYCSDLSLKIEKLAVKGTNIGDHDLKTRECMAPRVPPSQPPIAAIPSQFDGGDTLGEGDGSETSSSENDDDDDDDQGGNGNQGTTNSPQASGVSKAPIELLSSFLAALMKGEYHDAQVLCNQILEVEPDNPTCLEFRSTLQERIEQDEESDSSSDDDSEEDSDDPDDDDDNSGEDSGNEADEDAESDEDIDVNKLNLLMGGVPIKKES